MLFASQSKQFRTSFFVYFAIIIFITIIAVKSVQLDPSLCVIFIQIINQQFRLNFKTNILLLDFSTFIISSHPTKAKMQQPTNEPEVNQKQVSQTVEHEPSNQLNQQAIQAPEPKKANQFKPEFDWNLQSFDEQSAMKDFSRLAEQNIELETEKNNPKLYVAENSIKSAALNKYHVYILRGDSEELGKVEIIRKYSDFYALREALVRRWPGCFVPPLPEKGNIGSTEKQVAKNKLLIVTNFLNRVLDSSALASGEEFQLFVKSSENQVQKLLQKLKPHSLQNLFGVYKTAFPECFKQTNEEQQASYEQKIHKFDAYFNQNKKDLANQKDDIKRLAELRTKLTQQRCVVFEKSMPQFEDICLGWFHGVTQPQTKEEADETSKEIKQDQQDEEQTEKLGKIYSSTKYQNALEAYKNQLFPKDQGENDDWLIYQIFKFELKQIEAVLQAINTYRRLDTEKKYYQRNIEANRQQLQDINNHKMSLKILLLSGSQDEKKTQLANQTQVLQTQFKLAEQLWTAITHHMTDEIEKFQMERCQYYKKHLMRAFKKQAVYMAKLFNLYSEVYKNK